MSGSTYGDVIGTGFFQAATAEEARGILGLREIIVVSTMIPRPR